MRKLFSLFLPVLILSIGFVSCEKDEFDEIDEVFLDSPSDLIGTWKLVGITINSKINGEKSSVVNANTEQEILEIVDFIFFNFKNDGSYLFSEKKIDQIPEENKSDGDGWERGEWDISNGKLYLDGEKVSVTELTSTKMVLIMTDEETIEGDLYEFDMKLLFSKVD